MAKLDDTDRRILDLLQRDGRIANSDLARAIHLSPAPCLRRVQRLEADRVIKRYVALLDADQIGLSLNIFIAVSLDRQTKDNVDRFEQTVCSYPEVLECYWMAGETDYLLRVALADLHDYERFLMDRLTRIDGISNIRSLFAMRQVKYSTALPLQAAPR
jgi:Lrp/AsnC family leucine-responsive transcriptional regulator